MDRPFLVSPTHKHTLITHAHTHSHTHTHTHTHTHGIAAAGNVRHFGGQVMGDFKSAPKLISFANRQTEVGGGDASATLGRGEGVPSFVFVLPISGVCVECHADGVCVCVCVTEREEREFVRASCTNASRLKCCNRHNVTRALKNIKIKHKNLKFVASFFVVSGHSCCRMSKLFISFAQSTLRWLNGLC